MTLKIVEIETHEISVPYQSWAADVHTLLSGSRRRIVYIVHADNGLTGLGEGWNGPAGGPEPQSVLEKYIGTSPFDWIGDEVSFAIGTAMYDLMAKAVGIPVYKLFGPKRRSWVPFSGWTMPGNPQFMAEDVVDAPLPIVNGYVRVPEVSGLGVTLNREKLLYLKQLDLPIPDRWILKSQYANGTTMYNIHDPQDHRFYIRPEKEIPLRYDEPIVTEYWTDDGSSEYEMMLRRIEVEGTIVEREERSN